VRKREGNTKKNRKFVDFFQLTQAAARKREGERYRENTSLLGEFYNLWVFALGKQMLIQHPYAVY